MSHLFDRLIPLVPDDDIEAYHQGYLLVAACFLTGLFAAGYAVVDAYSGNPLGAASLTVVALAFFALPPLFRTTGSLSLMAHLFLLIGTAAVVFNTYVAGGEAVLPWLAVVPITGVLLAGNRAGGIWTLVAVLGTAAFTWLGFQGYDFPNTIAPDKEPAWTLMIRIGLPLIIFLIARIFQQEKARALTTLQARNDALEAAMVELERTQAQLIQQEKLASLGTLTAGIAHEIKNPLNFINNFAALSTELMDELEHEADPTERRVLLADLKTNAARIEQHGKRADAIVRSMIAHARQEERPRERLDLNRLVEEHVALAYQHQRTRQPGFTVGLEEAYDPRTGAVMGVREELGHVLLNLLDNAFYAVRHVQTQRPDAFIPAIRVETACMGEHIEVRVHDNGVGMTPEVQRRVFEPFFTTRPTGEGTGLGLSLSHDIVSARHGGTLAVTSTEGEGSTFVLTLPCASKGLAVPGGPHAWDPRLRLVS